MVTALAVLSFAACFSYKSVMNINDKGGGALSVQMQIPLNEAYTVEFEDYKEKLASIEGWQTTAITLDTIDSVAIFHLEGNFSGVLNTPSLFEADSFSFFTRKTGNTKKFILSKMYSPVEEGIASTEDKDYNPDDYHWCETIIGPGRIVKHNADKVLGDTLIWERRTVDVLEKGLVIDVMWEKED